MLQSKRKRILVVEDEADQRAMLKVALERAGYNVLLSQAGQHALTHAELFSPDVILLDLMLSGHMDGFEVLQRLKATQAMATIPVIICSAWGGDAQMERARDSGAIDYVVKPYEISDLLERVRRALPGASDAAAAV